ncbi:MAG: hypothetical protein KBA71_15665 [Opitutaceae bacterium]|nr:hypothetical protein [Opitutaceae bacterium]
MPDLQQLVLKISGLCDVLPAGSGSQAIGSLPLTLQLRELSKKQGKTISEVSEERLAEV